MKRLIVLLSLIGLVAFQATACDIKLNVQEKSKKAVYKTGDEVVIEVQVKLLHRNCSYEIQQTKFTYENLKIVGATDWKEVQPGLYTRQIKAKITNDKAGDAKISANRKCNKEGGYAVCTLKKA